MMTASLLNRCTHVFAVPGELSCIDFAHPDTGLSLINGETLAQVQDRYPAAELMPYEQWQAAKAATQNTPLTWVPVTEEQYMDMLNVLPPLDWDGGSFLVGEASDHCVVTGRARYAAYRRSNGAFFASSRPMTRTELRQWRESR